MHSFAYILAHLLVQGAHCLAPLRDIERTLLNQPVSWEVAHDALCTVNGRAFSGVRVLHERTLAPIHATTKRTAVLLCENGLGAAHAMLQANESLWSREIALAGSSSIVAVPRAEYNGTQLRYVPGTVVGGLFQRRDVATAISNAATEWVPWTPLVADDWTQSFYDANYGATGDSTSGAQVRLLTTLLRSPDPLDKWYPRTDAWAGKLLAAPRHK